jgi:hypothetical protein
MAAELEEFPIPCFHYPDACRRVPGRYDNHNGYVEPQIRQIKFYNHFDLPELNKDAGSVRIITRFYLIVVPILIAEVRVRIQLEFVNASLVEGLCLLDATWWT